MGGDRRCVVLQEIPKIREKRPVGQLVGHPKEEILEEIFRWH